MKHKVRDHYPTPHLRARLRRLNRELVSCWNEWESVGYPGAYTEEGRAYMMRVHDVRLAITQTMCALRYRKRRGKMEL